MFRRKFSKKASLNLSIEAIVVVVIAFTVLGLGLGFVKNQFKSFGDTSSQVSSSIKDQILESMRSSGKKLSVDREVLLDRGSNKQLNIGVVNTETSTAKFGITIEPIKKQNLDGSPGELETITDEVSFFYSDIVEKELSPTDGDVFPISITTKGSASGNYLYKVNVYTDSGTPGACDANFNTEPCRIYDTTTFFVRVS